MNSWGMSSEGEVDVQDLDLQDQDYSSSVTFIYFIYCLVRFIYHLSSIIDLKVTLIGFLRELQRCREGAMGGDTYNGHSLQQDAATWKKLCAFQPPSLVFGPLLNGAIPGT